MKNLWLIGVLALGAASAPAWAVHKCTDASGKTVFQDRPCADGGGQKVNIRSSNIGSADASGAGAERAERERGQVAELRRNNRLRDLEVHIPNARQAIENKRSACDREMAAVRSQKARAANNLAGATWMQSISTEMEAIAARCDTEQRVLNDDLQRLLDERSQLQQQQNSN